MRLKSISLINYKNFETQQLAFDSKINCIVGPNGIGKTNILDAIYHLSFGKSYFNPITSQNIRHGSDFFVIDGLYEKNDREEKVVISAKKNLKKIIKRNGKVYDTLREHIGFIPLVIISPFDRDLIISGSEARRKFMDGVISQSNPNYLTTLLKYTKAVSQRNALLKYFVANHTFDKTTLAIYDDQLHALGSEIFNSRKEFLNIFIPIFKKRYTAISGAHEVVNIVYQSKLDGTTLRELLANSLQKDRILQYTTVGIHKDDLTFEIDTYPIKKFGSQGQQKSFLIALKLAQFDFIKTISKVNPILLLDDVFDKLDAHRVAHIVQLVNEDSFGQLFISDTHANRTENIVKEISQSYKIIKLEITNTVES